MINLANSRIVVCHYRRGAYTQLDGIWYDSHLWFVFFDLGLVNIRKKKSRKWCDVIKRVSIVRLICVLSFFSRTLETNQLKEKFMRQSTTMLPSENCHSVECNVNRLAGKCKFSEWTTNAGRNAVNGNLTNDFGNNRITYCHDFRKTYQDIVCVCRHCTINLTSHSQNSIWHTFNTQNQHFDGHMTNQRQHRRGHKSNTMYSRQFVFVFV